MSICFGDGKKQKIYDRSQRTDTRQQMTEVKAPGGQNDVAPAFIFCMCRLEKIPSQEHTSACPFPDHLKIYRKNRRRWGFDMVLTTCTGSNSGAAKREEFFQISRPNCTGR
jgi:hypothetical protein